MQRQHSPTTLWNVKFEIGRLKLTLFTRRFVIGQLTGFAHKWLHYHIKKSSNYSTWRTGLHFLRNAEKVYQIVKRSGLSRFSLEIHRPYCQREVFAAHESLTVWAINSRSQDLASKSHDELENLCIDKKLSNIEKSVLKKAEFVMCDA